MIPVIIYAIFQSAIFLFGVGTQDRKADGHPIICFVCAIGVSVLSYFVARM